MKAFVVTLLISIPAFAQKGTGRSAAVKYFTKDVRPLALEKNVSRTPNMRPVNSSNYGKLGVFAGTFVQQSREDIQNKNIGGWSLRLDYQKTPKAGDYLSKGYQFALQRFQSGGQELSKLSFLWSFRFPREVVFPAYLGVAFGPGVFLRQLQDQSWLSADLKGFLGLRLKGAQSEFYIEGGVQNQFLVLSSGQYQGWFISSGVAYSF